MADHAPEANVSLVNSMGVGTEPAARNGSGASLSAMDGEALVDRSVHDLHKLEAMEAVLFAWHEPLPLERLAAALEVTVERAHGYLTELEQRLQGGGGLRLLETPEGWRLVTKPEFAGYVERLREPQRIRLSRAGLETLAIIAYQQPLTRAEIDQIRGVDSSGTLQTLIERGLVETQGRLEAPGRPVIYVTSPEFLEHFGMRSLADLPALPPSALAEQARDLFDRETRVMSDSEDRSEISPARDEVESHAESKPESAESYDSGARAGDPELSD